MALAKDGALAGRLVAHLLSAPVRNYPRDLVARVVPTIGVAMSSTTVVLLIILLLGGR